MLFNSIQFAVFLSIVFLIYWSIPKKYQWVFLLCSSYYFYMSWSAKYVVLILATTIISYFCAIFMDKTESQKSKKIIMLTALVPTIGILVFFKYFNFISKSMVEVLSSISITIHPITLKLLMPIGISFYTFQTIGYIIDVYKGKIKAVSHFGKYATFISFFPQITSGPIARANGLIPQLESEHSFDYEKITYGLKLMAWGFFKKLIIADTLAKYVDLVYDNILDFQGFSLILATFFFSIQIYCDFSGYTDIAIGVAKLFGIDLMTNFKSPYFSTSIKEFWSRWHISLSTWFRDYVYIPLGGSRAGKFRHNINLVITFLVSGLWHGANWTYIVWGGIHGVAQVIETNLLKADKNKANTNIIFRLGSMTLVFLFCSIAWVFFRASNINDAIYLFSNMFENLISPLTYLKNGFKNLDISRLILLKLSVLILPLVAFDYIALNHNVINEVSKLSTFKRWFIYILLIWMILLFMPSESGKEFIYFQF